MGCKALRLKAKDADQIDYCQLGKMAVVKASNQNKALADFQSEPRRASADSSTSTASWRPALAAPIEITDPAVRQFNIWSGFIIDSASRIDEAPVGLPHSSFFVVQSHDGKFPKDVQV